MVVAIIILLIIAISIILVCYFIKKNKEDFWMTPTKTWKVDRMVKDKNDYFYSIPGTYQSILNPRFGNLDYSANIKYNLPQNKHLGVPKNPLAFKDMSNKDYVEENFCNNCDYYHDKSNCCKPKVNSPMNNITDYAPKSYKEAKQTLYDTPVYNTLPVGDMTTINDLGEVQQPIVFDRYMFANQRSKLYGLGDPIRGDLPIVPGAPDWFRPSVHPQIDLRDGAMSVMGGINNDVSRELHALQNKSAGGGLYTLGGVDYAQQKNECNNNYQSKSNDLYLSAAQNDINVTAFP